MRTVKLLAPLGAVLAVIIGIQVWWSQGYSPTGHAADHFQSATVVFSMAFVLIAIVWALPVPERRQPRLWALLALVALAAVFNAQGNIQVVDAIGDEDWSLETVDRLGPTQDGFEEGHVRAERAALAGVVAAAALVIWLGTRRVISPRLCVGAVVACVLFPYWFFPGLGLVIVAAVLVIRRVRGAPADRTVGVRHPATS